MYISNQIQSALNDLVTQVAAFLPIYKLPVYYGTDLVTRLEKIEMASNGWTTDMLNAQSDTTGVAWSVLAFTRTHTMQRVTRNQRYTGTDDPGRVPHRNASLIYAAAGIIPVDCTLFSNRPELIELMEEFAVATIGRKATTVVNIGDAQDTVGYYLQSVDRIDFTKQTPSIAFTVHIDGYLAEPSPDEVAKGIDTINTIYHEV